MAKYAAEAAGAFDSDLKTTNAINIREGTNGVRTAVIRVPITPVVRIARTRKIRVGWSTCRVLT